MAARQISSDETFETSSDDSIMAIPVQISNTSSETETPRVVKKKYWDLTKYENRLRTFEEKWLLKFITPEQLARAGFYSMGRQDHVRCPVCQYEASYWSPGEDPLVEHMVRSPNCPMFNGPWEDETLPPLNVNQGRNATFDLSSGRSSAAEGARRPLMITNARERSVVTADNRNGTSRREVVETSAATYRIRCDELTFSMSRILIDIKNEDVPDVLLCKICAKEPLKVSFGPCGHVVACDECSEKLNPYVCPICRDASEYLMYVYIFMGKGVDQCSYSRVNKTPYDPLLCKICRKEEMGVAFNNCHHVYSCKKCVEDYEIDECPVCSSRVHSISIIYL